MTNTRRKPARSKPTPQPPDQPALDSDVTEALAAFQAEALEYQRREAIYAAVDRVASRVEVQHHQLQGELEEITKKVIWPQADVVSAVAKALQEKLSRAGLHGLLVGDNLILDIDDSGSVEWFKHVAIIPVGSILGLADRLKPAGEKKRGPR